MRIVQGAFFRALNLILYLAFCRQVKHFRRRVGYFPNIANPKRYHEKMLWRKIFDRNPLFVTFCDKLATKDYVRERLPGLRIPRTLWAGGRIEDAPEEVFRREVVVKANHGSSFNAFVRPDHDRAALGALTRQWLATTYGTEFHEWGYFGVRKTLFVEEHLALPKEGGLMDINIRCVNGRAVLGSVIVDNKRPDMKYSYFDVQGQPVDFGGNPNRHAVLPETFQPPGVYHDAVACAAVLSRGLDYARYDFLADGETLYAGEVTLYPSAGVTRATSEGLCGQDTFINPHWDLRKSWFLATPQPGWRGLYARLLRRELAGGRP